MNDPLLLVSAMAHATRHLGFGVTANLSHAYPYVFARSMSTLDHLTRGRIGWNIVTGHQASAARALGQELAAHDDRYAIADDFMQAVYKLWEGSWDDDAVRVDRERRIFADPAGIAQRHAGPYYRYEGAHLRALAAAHAGAVSGRRLQPGPALRRRARRMRVPDRRAAGGA